jgi:DNA polymerase-1
MPQNINWDTMIASHIIEERDFFTDLKFQAFVRWGVLGYDDQVEKFKSSVVNSVYNRLETVPWPVICRYNAMDAMFTKRLKKVQKGLLRDPGLNKANNFFQEGIKPLIKMTVRGIDADTEYMKKETERITKEVDDLTKDILKSDEAIKYKQLTGLTLDIASPPALKKLFFDQMGLPVIKFTEKGNAQIDADSLVRLNVPIASNIIVIRKKKKIKDYLQLCGKLSEDGFIHPTFNLHLAVTYRSSSDGPNLQNFPKRDEEANNVVRTGIRVPKGYQLMGADFGAMEVRGFAWYSKDPTLINELNNGMDPHGIWAEYLGISRFDAKNAFVFPLIYGSYWKSIHKEIRFRGYTDVSIERVQSAEKKFWDKYHYAKEWQERLIRNYYQTGYVETYLGFKRRGILTRNQIVNYPIQATCFHMLVWSYMVLDKIQEQEGWETLQIGQIHDENLFRLKSEELTHVGRTVERVMTKDILEEFDWINVPPIAEFSISYPEGTWAVMKKFTKEEKIGDRIIVINDWDSVENKIWPTVETEDKSDETGTGKRLFKRFP